MTGGPFGQHVTPAAEVFPYPDDSPEEISATRSAFHTLAGQVDSTSSTLAGDLTALGHGWSGDAADACAREITGTRRVADSAARAFADIATVLGRYLTVVDEARHHIDGIRANYDRAAVTYHQTGLTVAETAPSYPDVGLTDDEAWQRTVQALKHEYTAEVTTPVTTVARQTRAELERIGERVGPVRPAQANLARAVDVAVGAGLPFTSDLLAAKDGETAAGLLQKAARGDRAALRELARYRSEASDPAFATALVTALGPQGVLAIPASLSQTLADTDASGVDTTEQKSRNARILTLLSAALATATTLSNPTHVTTEWITQLEQHGRTKLTSTNDNGVDGRYYGYWSLAQILRASPDKPPYSAEFIGLAGRDMLGWIRANKDKGIGTPFGTNTGYYNEPGTSTDDTVGDTSSDASELTSGLLHAASGSAQAAQVLLDAIPLGVPTTNLDFILHLPGRWWADAGTELGHALDAAGSGTDPKSAKLCAMTIASYADAVRTATTITNGKATLDDTALAPGIRGALAHILATHINDLNLTVTARGGSVETPDSWNDGVHARFGQRDLASALLGIEQDEGAYTTLVSAQIGRMTTRLNQEASGPEGYDTKLAKLTTLAAADAQALRFLAEARGQGLESAARALDAANGNLSQIIAQGVALIPIPEERAKEYALQVGTFLTGQLLTGEHDGEHLTAAYAQADDYRTQVDALSHQMIYAAVINNHVWSPQGSRSNPVTDPANAHASFLDHSTNPPTLYQGKWSARQYRDFERWVDDTGAIPLTKQEADLLGDNGSELYRTSLGIPQ